MCAFEGMYIRAVSVAKTCPPFSLTLQYCCLLIFLEVFACHLTIMSLPPTRPWIREG